jgi:hypothetical protein
MKTEESFFCLLKALFTVIYSKAYEDFVLFYFYFMCLHIIGFYGVRRHACAHRFSTDERRKTNFLPGAKNRNGIMKLGGSKKWYM